MFELYQSIRSELAGVQSPMFTTSKALISCASCSKGIKNLQGMKAEHSNWESFPFKEPYKPSAGKRLSKSSLGMYGSFTNLHHSRTSLMHSRKELAAKPQNLNTLQHQNSHKV
mmetsp:Transcript_11345/g.19115  ORF Transcript_11345/g.19115 Transcript_11345/m.19115 type:complete len:113 (+) Transcript_11345:798-1136(+)